MQNLMVSSPLWTVIPESFLREFYSEYSFDRAFARDKDYPPYDICYGTDSKVVLEFALAGYSPDNVKITISGNSVTIASDKVRDTDFAGSRKIARRAFSRTFRDTENLYSLEDISAKMKDGILTVSIPPKEKLKSKEIKIVCE